VKPRARLIRRTPLRSKTALKRSPLRRKRKSDAQWQKARKVALNRSGGLCEARLPCCQGQGSQVHHILRRSQGGKHEESNLLTVCYLCHEYIHANPKEASEKNLLKIRKYDDDLN
jgi:5-methylcytosine-specific restriction endonuclease McrA